MCAEKYSIRSTSSSLLHFSTLYSYLLALFCMNISAYFFTLLQCTALLLHLYTRTLVQTRAAHACTCVDIFLRNILTHKFMCCKEVASLSNAYTLQPNAIILHTTTTITTNKHLHTVFESRCGQFVAKCVKGNVMLDLKM